MSVHGQLKCRTTADSKDPRKPCIFPFKFKGEKYFGCPPDPEVRGRRWCSTAVDNRGNHITGKGDFGFCEESCPKHKTQSKDLHLRNIHIGCPIFFDNFSNIGKNNFKAFSFFYFLRKFIHSSFTFS